MRKGLPCAFIILAVALLVGTLIYYTLEIIEAREHTRTVVDEVLPSDAFLMEVDDLTDRKLRILLAVQDPALYDHHGVDLATPGAGITTITQALAKHFYFDQFRPGLAKIKQTLIAAVALDPLVSKDDQLRLFINTCHLGSKDGQPIQGLESAAQAYFGEPFQDLNEDEYISLVATLIAPGTFSVNRYPERNAERAARIKLLISGEYQPKGVFDLYCGEIPEGIRQDGLPPLCGSFLRRFHSENWRVSPGVTPCTQDSRRTLAA